MEAGVAGHLAIMEWLLAEATAAGCQGDWLNLCCAALRGCDFATAKRLWGIYAPPLHQMEPAALQQAAPQQAALQQAAPQQGGAGGGGGGPPAAGLGLGPPAQLLEEGAEGDNQEEDEQVEDAAPMDPAAEDLQCALHSALRSPTPDWRAKADWLTSLGARPRPFSYHWAREGPSGPQAVERFEWLLARGCDPGIPDLHLTGSALEPAIDEGKGHERVLPLLQQAGYPLHRNLLLLAAASGGQVEALQWVEDNLPEDPAVPYGGWPGRTMPAYGSCFVFQPYCTPFAAAAYSGSVDAMRWLRAGGRGHAMEAVAWVAAVQSGCGAALEVLTELGCPMPTDGSPYAAAIELGEWTLLGRLGVPLGPDRGAKLMAAALEKAPVATLQWLVAAGCTADWRELGYTVGHRRGADVVAWLRTLPGGAEGVAQGAAEAEAAKAERIRRLMEPIAEAFRARSLERRGLVRGGQPAPGAA
ncbi:hypothetical protein HYH03_015236 [Edaphochlamys debaryana]|uniref:Uncharacterized protein n=1 Tax=Edaphochlamys debaryana TaxID=47281 RepID=A0A836BSQ6_9CHLO|nr:hypothetical protein HYH03_015236 [Edaphochlamys debaryana]|eukprot:KAG2486028.1 hypothetical protein HYH03_015236 [Edaphochlamys debaryana]